MQVFGNIATEPTRKESKLSQKGYYELRLAESQRGPDKNPTWYTVRIMKDEDPGLTKGDFVKVTGKLKTDFYLSREGKPTGTLHWPGCRGRRTATSGEFSASGCEIHLRQSLN